jgi:predicted transcriptional regulator
MNWNKEKSKKPVTKPESQIPSDQEGINIDKIEVMFTGQEVNLILQYLSKRPWAEVTNLMDLIRIRLQNTKVPNKTGEGINIQVVEKKEEEVK